MTKPAGLSATVFAAVAVAKRGGVARLERPKDKPQTKKRGAQESFDGSLLVAQKQQRPTPALEAAGSTKAAAPAGRVAESRRPPPLLDETSLRTHAAEPAPTIAAPPTPLVTPGPTFDEVKTVQPSRAPDPAHALLQATLHDASLQLDLSAHHMRVGLETEAAGALSLDVRLHDGRAEVHLDGPASPLVAGHAAELREVLAREGLSFGDFSQGGRSGHERPDEPAERRRAEHPEVPVKNPSGPRRHDGRIDVEA